MLVENRDKGTTCSNFYDAKPHSFIAEAVKFYYLSTPESVSVNYMPAVAVPSTPEVSTRQPYRCPICFGTMQVIKGFYDSFSLGSVSEIGNEPCRSCTNGVVWSE
jgi:hypothetical protein